MTTWNSKFLPATGEMGVTVRRLDSTPAIVVAAISASIVAICLLGFAGYWIYLEVKAAREKKRVQRQTEAGMKQIFEDSYYDKRDWSLYSVENPQPVDRIDAEISRTLKQELEKHEEPNPEKEPETEGENKDGNDAGSEPGKKEDVQSGQEESNPAIPTPA
eukprot:GHVU01228137.1.p2 GENE.GHVU01228137.1~~GHVU01228137.1.p2  ORF type:complete len:161 (+),score=23.36 GHVU01228137.1:113-595(+)